MFSLIPRTTRTTRRIITKKLMFSTVPETETPKKPLDADMEKKLDAFTSRTGLQLKDKHNLLAALTHPSFSRPNDESPRFQLLGNHILKFYTTEYVMAQFPQLPAGAFESIVDAYVGDASLASLGKLFGIQFAMQWKLSNKQDMPPASARSWIIQSLVGALYKEQGPFAVKKFIKQHILSRSVDVEAHIDLYVKLRKPRVMLSYLTKSLNKPNPVARLLKESGRISSTPVFVVGMYSGFEKLGEGYGSSLQMAETRAVKDALIKHYAAEVKVANVPSDFESEESISFFETPTQQ